MKDDDPEKRIRELEQQLADVTRPPQTPTPYTGGETYTENPPPYTGGATYSAPTYSSGPTYPGGGPFPWGAPQPRRRSYPWYLVLVLLAVVVPIIISLVMMFTRSSIGSSISRGGAGRTTSSGPTSVPWGGELRVSDNSQARTISCNNGKLTLAAYDSKYVVTGHCASLTVGGYDNNVTVDNADAIESTGYSNVVRVQTCNDGNLKISSYGNDFNVAGHCAGLAISSYNNKVNLESVDAITVSGYSNNVTYHTGTPKITNSGYDNNIQQG
ncbi:DUF3060 domain-containing protein [Mycobacterium sp. 1245805.9]|uniref:DUF3060 domain-containing protein n=1 Tax=Mycobacterium sp. 1245805.9 TaxID=1856862 RepID=UPI000800EA13|nr:DUF3060 domain-containing protein [Mycobacterium sp. 1245805.9]OBI85391.1 hypothetical protein A9X00_28115 [Mycobacterium sp. 1245805.9]